MFMLYDDYHHKILCVVCAFFPSISLSLSVFFFLRMKRGRFWEKMWTNESEYFPTAAQICTCVAVVVIVATSRTYRMQPISDISHAHTSTHTHRPIFCHIIIRWIYKKHFVGMCLSVCVYRCCGEAFSQPKWLIRFDSNYMLCMFSKMKKTRAIYEYRNQSFKAHTVIVCLSGPTNHSKIK